MQEDIWSIFIPFYQISPSVAFPSVYNSFITQSRAIKPYSIHVVQNYKSAFAFCFLFCSYIFHPYPIFIVLSYTQKNTLVNCGVNTLTGWISHGWRQYSYRLNFFLNAFVHLCVNACMHANWGISCPAIFEQYAQQQDHRARRKWKSNWIVTGCSLWTEASLPHRTHFILLHINLESQKRHHNIHINTYSNHIITFHFSLTAANPSYWHKVIIFKSFYRIFLYSWHSALKSAYKPRLFKR